jgi:hypothetical protein
VLQLTATHHLLRYYKQAPRSSRGRTGRRRSADGQTIAEGDNEEADSSDDSSDGSSSSSSDDDNYAAPAASSTRALHRGSTAALLSTSHRDAVIEEDKRGSDGFFAAAAEDDHFSPPPQLSTARTDAAADSSTGGALAAAAQQQQQQQQQQPVEPPPFTMTIVVLLTGLRIIVADQVLGLHLPIVKLCMGTLTWVWENRLEAEDQQRQKVLQSERDLKHAQTSAAYATQLAASTAGSGVASPMSGRRRISTRPVSLPQGGHAPVAAVHPAALSVSPPSNRPKTVRFSRASGSGASSGDVGDSGRAAVYLNGARRPSHLQIRYHRLIYTALTTVA